MTAGAFANPVASSPFLLILLIQKVILLSGNCTQGEQAWGLQTRRIFGQQHLPSPLFLPQRHHFRESSPVEYSWAVPDLAMDAAVWAAFLSLDVSTCWAWLRSWLHGRPPDFISQCIRQLVSSTGGALLDSFYHTWPSEPWVAVCYH